MIIKKILYFHILFKPLVPDISLFSTNKKLHSYSLLLKCGHYRVPSRSFFFFQHQEDSTLAFFLIFFLKRHIEEAWNLCETVKSSSPYLVVQSLNKHFLSILPQNMHIIPSSLQVIKLFLQRLLLEVRLVLDPFGSTCH